MDFEAVIGLEVHAQLTTESKLFCGSSAAFGAGPNEHSDPYTLGMPGVLPVLNEKVIEYAIMLGLALNCEIRKFNRFARKHYFYPDLPKGYQISQFEEPICERGRVKVVTGDVTRAVGITRIHMEEDAGKSIHDPATGSSLVDLNRAGVPLLEIVSEPDIRTPAEASAYMKALRQVLRYLEICDGNMEEGSLRCDANVSIRTVGDTKFGTRAEIKNLNSFKFVERALEYEIARQIAIVKAGDQVVQETRLFDSEAGTTASMRSKEESSDYRYFPDPDLPPLRIKDSRIEEIRSRMPMLPEQAREKLVGPYGLDAADANVLVQDRMNVDFFEGVFEVCSNPRSACSWITSELFGALNKKGLTLSDSPVSAASLGELVKLIDTEVISGKMAKTVFEEMMDSGQSPGEVVEEKGLRQVTDREEIRKVLIAVLEEHPDQVEKYVGGQTKLSGFFIGQAMKATGGKLNPQLANEILQEELDKRTESWVR